MRLRLEVKPQDCWVGVFWKSHWEMAGLDRISYYDVWVCLLPMLPLHFSWDKVHR